MKTGIGLTYPISYVDFVRGRKQGKSRLERLLLNNPTILPQEGWNRLTHRGINTDDNKLIEEMKNNIRLQLAALSVSRTGERRLWPRKSGVPSGFYPLDYYDVNRVVSRHIEQSGLYVPGAA
jgi:hypothetical protein